MDSEKQPGLVLLVGREGMIKEQNHLRGGFLQKKPKKLEFSTQNVVNALEDGINRYKQVNNMAAKIRKLGDNTGRFLHFPSFSHCGRNILIISCGNRMHSLRLCCENLPVTPVPRTMPT